jgi:molybdenum cofactor synthesis domain-containing protein
MKRGLYMDMASDPPAVNAATLVVGNEILLGRTQDTNTLYLAEYLLNRGIKLGRWVIVPDKEEQIISELRRLIADRFGIIIVSGGMGPTHDDITVSSIAKALDLPLVRSDKAYDRMISKWKRRNPGMDMPENAEKWLDKMSMVPAGFDCLENDQGMAEGLIGESNEGKTKIFILPGVPREYKTIIDSPGFCGSIPDLCGEGLMIEEILFRGRESSIAGLLLKLQESFPDVDFGSYPHDKRKVIIRLTGKPSDVEEALKMAKTSLDGFDDGF